MILKEHITEQLKNITDPANILVNEDMSAHTTFRIGGCADVFVTPQSMKEAADIVRLLLANDEPYTVIGNGSNILVSDKGYRGCIVCMGHGMDHIKTDGTAITAGAGAILSKVAYAAYENGLGGLEFASGIPGSVGGAIVMNAGAYGGEMKDVTVSVTVLDAKRGNIITIPGKDMRFGYRTSVIKEYPYIVLEASFELLQKDREQIKTVMDDLAAKRRSKQPLEYPSAGSTFKRPEGYFAGKLIEDAGLKGFTVGGAMVSEKHSGFVINSGGATAGDVMELIRTVRRTVYDKFEVMLEPEVVMLGEDIKL